MSNKSENILQDKNGLNFSSALTLLFIGLKLTNQIDWIWFWVLSPMFANLLLASFVIFIAYLMKK